jgi:hypothetical protein
MTLTEGRTCFRNNRDVSVQEDYFFRLSLITLNRLIWLILGGWNLIWFLIRLLSGPV